MDYFDQDRYVQMGIWLSYDRKYYLHMNQKIKTKITKVIAHKLNQPRMNYAHYVINLSFSRSDAQFFVVLCTTNLVLRAQNVVRSLTVEILYGSSIGTERPPTM